MSKINLTPNASGTGTLTVTSPNTNSDYTLTLPAVTGTFNTSGAVNEVPAGTVSAPSIYFTGDTNTGIFSPAADTIAFTEGGAEAMRIDSSGRVSIGTSSTVARLQSSNAAATATPTGGSAAGSGFYITNTDTAYGMMFGNSSNGDGWIQQQRSDGTNTQYNLLLQPIGGNVGIGTSSPANILTVQTAATGTTAGSNVIARLQANGLGRDATLQLSDNVANSATISMVAGAMAFRQNGVDGMRLDVSSNFQFNSGYGSVATAYGCRAWVNFNGTGTVAIRASGNVTSITDNGTGDYTVNFTNAMPDANSSVNVTCQRMDVTTFEATYSGIRSNTSSNITTTSVRVYTAFSTTAAFDAGQVCVAVFR